MNSTEQAAFVVSLTTEIQRYMLQRITTGRVPDNWDGHELRRWLADLAQQEVMPMSRSRVRAYHNSLYEL